MHWILFKHTCWHWCGISVQAEQRCNQSRCCNTFTMICLQLDLCWTLQGATPWITCQTVDVWKNFPPCAVRLDLILLLAGSLRRRSVIKGHRTSVEGLESMKCSWLTGADTDRGLRAVLCMMVFVWGREGSFMTLQQQKKPKHWYCLEQSLCVILGFLKPSVQFGSISLVQS